MTMIRDAIAKVARREDLSADEAAQVMDDIMSGEATPAQFGAFVTALRMKGETVDEIAGLARGMRARALSVQSSHPVVDTCGTGGDNLGTFNISTTATFVAAGAGAHIAKHGNRAMSSACGSADVLEALGVKIDLEPAAVERCLDEIGIGFMFAQVFHPAMKYAAGPRREIGIRTVFNILGPLTNPAGAERQVLGVSDEGLTEKMGEVLRRLGAKHALVVHGLDGLDELSITGPSMVAEVQDGAMRVYSIDPAEFGISRASVSDLKGGSAQWNASIVRDVLEGEHGPPRDIVLLNAAAALVAAGIAPNLGEGIAAAAASIDSGAARGKLEAMIDLTNRL